MSVWTRREVIATGAGMAVSPWPRIWLPQRERTTVIASGNGHVFKNGGARTCVEEAFARLTQGEDPLESLVHGANIVELDPTETSVGFGGLPNADGVVQLDASCMHGAKGWAGAVGALEGVRTPSRVALRVASDTDHHLLVGRGAQDFARNMGFVIEPDLNTDRSRKAWLDWKRRIDPEHYLDPAKRDRAGMEALAAMVSEGLIDPLHAWGTLHCAALSGGALAALTTTSGLAFKIPGRVGDSPILGAGLFVDGKVGTAGSTGRGEANLSSCASFLIVEEMRRGSHPKDACMAAMRRIKANTREKRLLDSQGLPAFGMEYYAMDLKGRHAAVSTSKGSRYAVCDDGGPRFETCEHAWG